MIQAMATVIATPVMLLRQDRMLGLRWRSLGNKISHHGRFGYSQVVRTRTALAARAVSTTPTRPRTEGLPPLDQERISQLNGLLEEILRTAISTGPRGATRFAQGIEAVLTVGSEYLSQQLQGAQISLSARAPFTLDPPGPAQLRRLFERLGATYIKLGQFIASAPTLFPADYVKEFQSCLDKTPPVPFDRIKAIIREDLGRPLEEVYEYIDPEPLASASVAQVHAAKLKESRKDVVIKVLKPGVEDILTVDLNFIYITARILEFLNPQLSRTSLVGIVGDLRASMLEEVDFRKEAVSIEAFRNYVEATGASRQATAPFVYKHCTSRRVLTMERFFGVPLTDLESIRSIVPNPEATLINALNVWFGSLIACESFHADVHAGNLLVLHEGRKEPAFVPLDRQTDGRKEGTIVPVEPSLASPTGHRSGFMYRPFVDFAVEELSRHPDVSPVLLKEEFRNMTAQGVNAANIDNKAFTSSKIRMFRIASIDTGPMQVLNVAGFPRPDYDLPIFCADFFSVPKMNIIVLDLNPLYNTDSDKGYKERFYSDLLPLANKYIKFFPWGDKLTPESLRFFSPLVLWTKPPTDDVGKFLYPAFQDYLKAWLNMVDSAQPAVDPVAIAKNQEAQHRYISWRTTKDPGRPVLTKLFGEQLAESYIKEFLFNGHSTLGTKSFLDYFPEYRGEDGSMYKQRSMTGKSFEARPWDKDGNFL